MSQSLSLSRLHIDMLHKPVPGSCGNPVFSRRRLVAAMATGVFSSVCGEVVYAVGKARPAFYPPARELVAARPAVAGANGIVAESLYDVPVLVTFFASWCPPCFEEFSHLNQLHEKYSDSALRIIAINVHEQWDENDEARIEKFILATSPAFAVVKGSEQIRQLFGGIDRIPTVYGFDAAGDLHYHFKHRSGSSLTNAGIDELDAAAKLLLSVG